VKINQNILIRSPVQIVTGSRYYHRSQIQLNHIDTMQHSIVFYVPMW